MLEKSAYKLLQFNRQNYKIVASANKHSYKLRNNMKGGHRSKASICQSQMLMLVILMPKPI